MSSADRSSKTTDSPAADESSKLEQAPALPGKTQTGSGLSPESADVWFKHYTDQFSSGITKTNTILLAWGGSLIVVLVAYIIPLHVKAARLNKLRNEMITAEKFIEQEKKRKQEIQTEKGASDKKPAISLKKPAGPIKGIDDAIAVVEAKAERGKQERGRLQQELSVIKTPLGDLPIPTDYLPLVWMCLFAGLFNYFLYRRMILLGTLAQIVDIQIRQRRRPIEDVRGLGAWAPFWLAPLPGIVSKDPISMDHLRQFLGWEPKSRRQFWFSLCSLAIATALYVWVLVILLRVSADFSDPQSGLRVRIISFLVSAICLLTATLWLWPRINLHSFPERVIEYSRRRRVFLRSSGSLIAVGFMYALVPRNYLPRFLSAKAGRFKKHRRHRQTKPLGEEFHDTFQQNQKSRVIHYIDRTGQTKGQTYLKPGNLQRLAVEVVVIRLIEPGSDGDPNVLNRASIVEDKKADGGSVGRSAFREQIKTARFPTNEAGRLIECLSLEEAQKGNTANSLKLLWGAIRQDTRHKRKTHRKPDYRLYDLLARFAAQSGASELSMLDDYIKDSWNDDEVLNSRKLKWLDPASKWRAKISGGKMSWKTPNKGRAPDGYCRS